VWEASNQDAVSKVEIKSTDSQATAPSSLPLTTQFQYKNYIQVDEISLYNSIQMWLLRLLSDNGGLDLADTTKFFSDHLQHSQAERTKRSHSARGGTSLSEVAILVLRSFEYQLESFYRHRDCAWHGFCQWDWLVRCSRTML